MTEHNFERLKNHILPLSQSDNFENARKEWEFESAYITEEFDNCPCGKGIKEHCLIKNLLNENRTYVGNVCIKRFMEIDTGTLFDGLKRIKQNLEANANLAVIEYASKKGFIYEKSELEFLITTKDKRRLSVKQKQWKAKVNRRILLGIQVKEQI